MAEKKKRSPNFNNKEEAMLVALVKKYRSVLECKLSDTSANFKKTECWEQIEIEFNNAIGETFRTKEILRKKYENIKKRTKQKFADEKCYARGTGGGPPMNIEITSMDTEIREMLGTRCEGRQTEFDGDAELVKPNALLSSRESNKENVMNIDPDAVALTAEDNFSTVTFVPFHDSETCDDNLIDKSQNEGILHPTSLKRQKSAPLRTSNSKSQKESIITKRISQSADAKAAMEENRNRYLDEEQKLKFKLIREKHDQEMIVATNKADLELGEMKEYAKGKQEKHEQEMLIARNKAELDLQQMREYHRARMEYLKN